MKRVFRTPLALLVAVALVGAACGGGNETGGQTPTSGQATETGEGGTITIGSDQANDHGTKDVSGMDEIELEMDDFYFEPTVLKGTAGQEIKLELENEGQVAHNFTLEDQGVDQDVEAGEDANVTVTLPQSGFLEFFCKFHRGQGMVGELTV